MTSETSSSGFTGILRDLRTAVVEMFGGNKLPEQQQVAVEVLFAFIGFIAKADSIVTSHEAELVNTLMDELELPTHGRAIASAAFERGFRRNLVVATEAERIRAVYPKGSPELSRLLDTLVRVVLADGRLFPRERSTLEEVALALGFDAEAVRRRLGNNGA
ncbi:MAG: TerB family tellurite resistance protein [Lysobacteraceae bacterium]